ncbi:MAG: hypothetical protein EXQ88_03045 [Alphaproteobacteria bacterium]|nr:hypothetical protein [Alphaproteobacteria bacterium]
MTTLKVVVIALGVLIVALLAAIIWKIVALAGGAGDRRGFGEMRLGLPAGCRIVEAQSGDGRLVLRIGDGAGCDRVLLVDPVSGRVLGTILP